MMKHKTHAGSLPYIHILNVLFIAVVLFLHHGGYARPPFKNFGSLNVFLMYFSVGGFIFFSAYKLAKTKLQDSFAVFWKNRLTKIYPLYALAVLAFYFIVYSARQSPLNLIKHLFALQMIFPNLFGDLFLTLYFIGLLFVFYLFFSLSKKQLSRPGWFVAISIGVFFAALLLRIMFSAYNEVFMEFVFIYFPVFTAGMLVSQYEERIMRSISRHWLLTSILFFIMFSVHLLVINYFPADVEPNLLLTVAVTGLTIIPLYLLLIHAGRSVQSVPAVVRLISHASFTMFLFHRPIWTIMARIYSERSLAQWFYIVLLGVPVIIAISYSIQLWYDRLMRSMRKT